LTGKPVALKRKTNKKNEKVCLLGAVSPGGPIGDLKLWAEETNTVEMIRQLQQRIEDLEQKLKQLERAKLAAPEQEGKERVQETGAEGESA